MSQKNHLLVVLTIVVSAMTVLPAVVAAQADMAPVNDIPNPYTTMEGWAKLHDGRTWGSSSSVDLDPDGVSNPGKIFPTTRFCAESNPKARGYDRVPLVE